MKKINAKKAVAIISVILFALVLTGLLVLAVIEKTATWFDNNDIITQSPVSLHKPVSIVKRKVMEERVYELGGEIVTFDSPIEEYICEKFGKDCIQAISLAHAESNMRVDAWNANENGTLDVGIFQVNSIHWNKEGCSFADLTVAEKNVDCAFTIYTNDGNCFKSWVAFTGTCKKKE